MTPEQIEQYKNPENITKFYFLRLGLSLSQQEMAKKLGISICHYSNIESGKRLTSMQVLSRLKKLCQEHNTKFDINELI